MKLFGHTLHDVTDSSLYYSNDFEIHSIPFEEGARSLVENSFDFVFTSPPYFDYEMYSSSAMPIYKDWIQEFYTPLIQQACRCLMQDKFMAIHISDSSAGSISSFLTETVKLINMMN